MAKVHGGLLVAKMLKAEDVRFVFSLCGGHINAIYDGCLAEGIKIIDARNEQAAAFMAQGWALATGQTGICCFTAGPGVTNAVTGIANAAKDLTPMVVIGGSIRVSQYDTNALQELNQVRLLDSITNWARTVYDVKRIPEYMSTAFRQAWGSPRGPVFLEIPKDILDNEVDDSEVTFPQLYRTKTAPTGDPTQIKTAAALLDKAQRPMTIVGSGGFWANAAEALQTFTQRTGVPVFTRYGGRGLLPADHELHFNTCVLKKALDEADVILLIGNRLDAWVDLTSFGNFGPKAKLIQVDTDVTEIGHGHHQVDIGIVGDARLVLEQLAAAASKSHHQEWCRNLREKEEAAEQILSPLKNSESTPIHPLRVVNEIDKFIDRADTFVHDGGDIGVVSNMVCKAYLPGRLLSQGMPFGALGSGMPFAMAAKLARPDTQVLLLTGDGTFGFSAMEFDTCVRHGINIVTVIANNQCWGMIKRLQEHRYGPDRIIGTTLGVRPYHKVVEALGGYGELVERPENIRPALERAFTSGVPACVNVMTDTSVHIANIKL